MTFILQCFLAPYRLLSIIRSSGGVPWHLEAVMRPDPCPLNLHRRELLCRVSWNLQFGIRVFLSRCISGGRTDKTG